MINYNLTNIHEKLSKNSNVFVLYGAGDIGELAMYALEKLNIKVSYFCDSNKDKNGTKYFDVTVLSPDELYKLDRNINIFISNNYISVLKNQLKEKNFFNIFDCNEILQNTIFPLDKKLQRGNSFKFNFIFYTKICYK